MADPTTIKTTLSSSLMIPDWTKLPEELFQVISEKLDNCFDVVHARSVCSLWRSTIPFPCSLLRPRYSLPAISFENLGLCSLEKIPLFLFRVPIRAVDASDYFMGGIGRRDESEDHMEFPCPLQCSVKIPRSDPTLVNMLDCQILSLGYQYRMIGWELKDYRGVAFLPVNKEGGRGFVVILNCSNSHGLWVLTSAEMKWKLLENVPDGFCGDLVTFRGRFYASFPGEIVVIDPYSLDVTYLIPSSQPLELIDYLVPSGNDELFLVKLIIPTGNDELVFSKLTLRVSRLDEEAGKWFEVSDLGDRVLFINLRPLGYVCCSAKELPDGCGVSGNSIVFTAVGSETNTFKYVGREEDDPKIWTLSREKRVIILSTSPAVALRG